MKKTKKGFFLSLVTLSLIIVLVSFSVVIVANKGSSTIRIVESIQEKRLSSYAENMDSINLEFSNVSYTNNVVTSAQVEYHFSTIAGPRSSYQLDEVFTNFSENNYQDHSGKKYSVQNTNGSFQFASYNISALYKSDLLDIGLSMDNLTSLSLNIYLEANEADFDSCTYPSTTGDTSEPTVNIYVYDLASAELCSMTGRLVVADTNILVVDFNTSDFNFTFGTVDGQTKIRFDSTNSIYGRIDDLVLTFDDLTKLNSTNPKISTSPNSESRKYKTCDKNSDCFSSESCIYKKCFENVEVFLNFNNHDTDTIFDSSSNSNDAINSGVTGTIVSGYSGYAGYFNADNMNVGALDEIEAINELTICGWIKVDSYGTGNSDDGAIFAKGVGTELVGLWYDQSITNGYSFVVGDMGVTGSMVQSTASAASTSNIQFICGVMNNRERELYINGVLNSNSTSDSEDTTPVSASSATLGYWEINTNYDLKGALGDVMILSKALTQSEISYLYKNGLKDNYIRKNSCGKNSDCDFGESCIYNFCQVNTIGNWDMEELNSTYLMDQSGNENHAALEDDAAKVTTGYRKHGVKFDGSLDQLSLSKAWGIANSDFSIIHWMKTNQTTKTYTVSNAAGSSGFAFGVSPENIQYFIGNGGASIEDTCGLGLSLNDNEWHMIAGVYNVGSEFKCYVDGNLEETIAMASYPGISDAIPTVATSNLGDSFAGEIDELMAFRRVLTDDEVKSIFDSSIRRRYR